MRMIQDLSKDWLFSKTCSEVPCEWPVSGNWECVTLPHTWNAVDGQIGIPFDRGAYWYVTRFTKPQQPTAGGRVYIEVGAASLVGEVYVNGKFATRHVGGFSAFRADVTDLCHEGENVLAILCDNRASDKVYPQRADFTFYGGLYRYVHVISVAEGHFTLDDLGSLGVYIDAVPEGDAAKVTVRAGIDGVKNPEQISVEITDEDGEMVSEAWAAADKNVTVKLTIPEAKLWDGTEEAHLYHARLRLVSYNEVLDEVETDFGVRTFAVDKEKGFILNGREYPLHGVCRHQDRLYEGNALSQEETYEDACLIAEMGANCVRLAHYQQSQDMYDACDELGLAVWAEIPYFATSWDDDAHAAAVNEIKEMCAQNYNHPSIFFWGLSNEILISGNDNPKLLGCHEDLQKAVKSIDRNRLTVIAHEYAAGWDHPLHEISDVEAWNHYFGWYRGNFDDLGKWADEYHAKYPDRRVAISEYGCDALLTYHSENPVKMDYTEEYQAMMHEAALEVFSTRPWIWGTFVWNMFDFGSFFRKEGGTKGRNNKGLVTMDRKIKKDSFYVYKAWLGKEPFVHIDGRRFYERPGKTTTVTVHSNLNEVSLYVDGVLFGTKTGSHSFTFENVPLSEAGSAVTARSGHAADTITLRSVENMPDAFTFPAFKRAQDATNWFQSVEEVAGGLEAKEGYYSVHDTVGEILKNDAAKNAVMNCLVAITQRALGDDILEDSDPNLTISEFVTASPVAFFFKGKEDLTVRKIHGALVKIEKK